MASSSLNHSMQNSRNTRFSMFEIAVSTRLPFITDSEIKGISKHWGILGASILRSANPYEKMYLSLGETKAMSLVESKRRPEKWEDSNEKKGFLANKYLTSSLSGVYHQTKEKPNISLDEITKPSNSPLMGQRTRLRRKSCSCKNCGEMSELQLRAKDIFIHNDFTKQFRNKLEQDFLEGQNRNFTEEKPSSPSKQPGGGNLRRSLTITGIGRRESKIVASSLISILSKRPSVSGENIFDFDKSSQVSSEDNAPIEGQATNQRNTDNHSISSNSMSKISENKEEETISPLIPRNKLNNSKHTKGTASSHSEIDINKGKANGVGHRANSQKSVNLKFFSPKKHSHLLPLISEKVTTKELTKIIKEKEKIHRNFKSHILPELQIPNHQKQSSSLDKNLDILRAYESGPASSRGRTTKNSSNHFSAYELDVLKTKLLLNSSGRNLGSFCPSKKSYSPRENLLSSIWDHEEGSQMRAKDFISDRILPPKIEAHERKELKSLKPIKVIKRRSMSSTNLLPLISIYKT